MARLAFIICIVLATTLHMNSAQTPLSVIQSNLTNTVNSAQGIVNNINSQIQSNVATLGGLTDISAITTLINGLGPDLLQIVSAVQSTAGNTIGAALSTVQTAVNTINNAVTGAIPALNGIVTALTAILGDVVNLVNSLLQLLLGLTTSLISNLESDLGGILVSQIFLLFNLNWSKQRKK
jgi:phage-related protein